MGKKEIIQKLEQLPKGGQLKFKLHETFGGGFAIAEVNPKFPDKGKAVAGWVADRLGELIP